DPVKQSVIDAAHGLSSDQRRPVNIGKALGCSPVIVACPRTFELHQFTEGVVDDFTAQLSLTVTKLAEVFLWKVDAIARGVLPQVSKNIGQLKRNSEVDGVFSGPR